MEITLNLLYFVYMFKVNNLQSVLLHRQWRELDWLDLIESGSYNFSQPGDS